MKNMKVSMKLTVSFLVVAILCLAVGIVSIIGMGQINNASNNMYEVQTKPLPNLAKTLEYIQRLRIQFRNVALATGNPERIKTIEADIIDRKAKFEGYTEAYYNTIVNPKGFELHDQAMDAYKNTFLPALDRVLAGAKAGDSIDILLAIMDETTSAANLIVDNFTECMNIKVAAAETANNNNAALYSKILILIIVVLVIAVAVSIFFALYISGLISKPLTILTTFMNRAGSTGDIALSKEDASVLDVLSKSKDEVGQCIASTYKFVRHLFVIGKKLEMVANGDLTVEIKILSSNDTIGVSIQKMVGNLNEMFSEVYSSTAQVTVASKQVADGSQTLAQGSTEQAAIVEQLSSSVTEISQKTKENAEMAGKAATLANTIKGSAEKGSHQMDEMMAAVKDINDASHNISKVIKVIDDIAFQTNILALNAAVEAARAGQHGKGFAVVAEEVRNLAAKSASAAKDTGELISNTIEKAELGSRIAGETAVSLAEIVMGINESSQLVGEIANSSENQFAGISQINKGIDQVAQTIQQTSATAEESAAASEEMSGQAVTLEGLIAQFKLKDDATDRFRRLPPTGKSSQKQLAMFNESSYTQSGDNASKGKY